MTVTSTAEAIIALTAIAWGLRRYPRRRSVAARAGGTACARTIFSLSPVGAPRGVDPPKRHRAREAMASDAP